MPVKKPNHKYAFSLRQNGAFDLVEVKSRKRRSFVRRRYIEAMIVADESMYKAFGEQEIELRSYLLSMMAIVSIVSFYKNLMTHFLSFPATPFVRQYIGCLKKGL